MQTHIYLIRALTNLHPGSGDNDYGVVDRMVQRDPTTGAPTIHTSGIKGALRQYFADQLGDKGQEHDTVTDIFGAQPQSTDFKQGKIRLISADLLAIPVVNEAIGGPPFNLVHDTEVLRAWNEKVSIFLGESWTSPGTETHFGNPDAQAFHRRYRELPVIARNYLDNGESKNLWYEEIVPRESVFGFIVQGEAEELDIVANGQSASKVAGIDGKVVQLGANATVGYGYCLFTKIA